VKVFGNELGVVDSDATLYIHTATLQGMIREMDQMPLRSWVVDLRRNTSGNMFPMLTG